MTFFFPPRPNICSLTGAKTSSSFYFSLRELQQQLGVLRAVRQKRSLAAAKDSEETEEISEPIEETGKYCIATDDCSSNFALFLNRGDLSVDKIDEPSTPEITEAFSDLKQTGETTTREGVEADNTHEDEDDLVIQGAASNVYESVKDAWTFGRHNTPLSPILGVAEGLTSHAVGLFGTDMKGLDDALKPRVADLDEHVLMPTLSNVSNFLMKKPNNENGVDQEE